MIWLLLLCCTWAPTCPTGTSPDATRRAAIQSIVPIPEGIPMCFGQRGRSVITESGTLLVNASPSNPELAARIAHLLVHQGTPPPKAGPGCLESWIQMEVDAHTVELQMRARLKVTKPIHRFDFESSWQDDETGRAQIRALLNDVNSELSHLRKGYSKRCTEPK